MKQILNKYIALSALILVTVLACQKEEQSIHENSSASEIVQKAYNVDTEQIQNVLREYKGREVRADFIGRIIDQNDQPILGAVVKLGSQQQISDENGIVIFSGTIVNENFAYARAFASGYTNGSRVMVPSGSNSFTIKLFQLEATHFIESGGGEVSVETELGNNLNIQFGGGFFDENGNPYSGPVAVTVNYLDPLSEDTANTMPGELYGIDANFQQVALGSYGMVNVELRGSAGEKLQIASPAQIEIPIHPAQMGTAASQVPMWSFNEDTGVWVEESVAYNTGSHYVAQVDHFSFWNCDAPFPVVNFNATVTDAGTGTPLAGVRVTISYSSFSRFAITDSSGNVSGKIPSGQVLDITVSDQCGTVLFNNPSYGPFSSATSITIPVTLSTSPISVSGNVLNCASMPVTNGYVTYTTSTGQFLATALVTAGTHSYSGVACSIPVTINLEGGDMSTGQLIASTSVVANPTAVINLSACGGLAPEYVRYNINGAGFQYDLMYPYGGIDPPNYHVAGAGSHNSRTEVLTNTAALGVYPYNHNLFAAGAPVAGAIFMLNTPNGIDPAATTALGAAGMTFTITNFGAVGAYIDISFSGNYIDMTGAMNTISGDAHIIRDF
jgi:hypothetical protein